jgi:hypothetical protein
MKNNTKKQISDSHIPAISLCLSGNGETVYQDLGDNKIEVAEILTMPFHMEEEHVNEFRLFALNFVWWFELLKQYLLHISSSPEDVVLRFLSKDELVYSVILNCDSISEANAIISNINKSVCEVLGDKLKSASELYSLEMLHDRELEKV